MGQAKKKRDCPATGKAITPAECGEKRGSVYACPASCPFNPWILENYAQTIDIHDRMTPKAVAAIEAKYGNRALFESPQLEREIAGGAAPLGRDHHTIYNLHLRPRESGLSFSEEWRRSGFKPLNNDERFLFSAQMKMRVGLVELRGCLGEHTVEAVDLLDPERKPFLIADFSLARMACRFSVLLTWLYDLPHYTRIFATAQPITRDPDHEPEEILYRIVEHLGGPGPQADAEEFRAWLLANLPVVSAAITALYAANQDHRLSAIDAAYCRGVYNLAIPLDDFAGKIGILPCVQREKATGDALKAGYTDRWEWDASPEDENAATGGLGDTPRPHPEAVPLLGSVWARQGQACVVAQSELFYRRLRDAFEKHFGKAVRFVAEQIDDQAAQTRTKRANNQYDKTLVPPSLIQTSSKIALFTFRMPAGAGTSRAEILGSSLSHTVEDFPDQAIPVLGGKTPREAATDPALRPILVRVVKERINDLDKRNREEGTAVDINPVIRELGLHELDIAPPPLSEPVYDDADYEDDLDDEYLDDEEYGDADAAADRIDEIAQRIGDFEEILANAESTVLEFQCNHSLLSQDIHSLLGELNVTGKTAELSMLAFAHAWLYYFPSHRKAPQVCSEDLDDYVGEVMENIRTHPGGNFAPLCSNSALFFYLTSIWRMATPESQDNEEASLPFAPSVVMLIALINLAEDITA